MKRLLLTSILVMTMSLCIFFISENNDDKFEIVSIKENKKYNNKNIKIPILMYHSINDNDAENKMVLPINMFKEQILWLNYNNFNSLTLDEAIMALENDLIPENPIVITFDDGYVDNYENAFPILKENNIKATFFVITNFVGDGYYMSADMLKEMQSTGMEIENHTIDHARLSLLSRENIYNEIKGAQEFLRDNIGASGDYLAYPFGWYSNKVINIANELNIKAAVTIQKGKISYKSNRYKLKRIEVAPMSIEEFKKLLS